MKVAIRLFQLICKFVSYLISLSGNSGGGAFSSLNASCVFGSSMFSSSHKIVIFGYFSMLVILSNHADIVMSVVQEDLDEVTWQTYKGSLTEKQQKTLEKVQKRHEKVFFLQLIEFCTLYILEVLDVLGPGLVCFHSYLDYYKFLVLLAAAL